MLEPQTLRFLSRIKKNNNRAWFESHRADYEAARIDYANFIDLVIDELQKLDPSITGLTSRDCVYRFYRDIRFSKDKTPYKDYFGASIKRSGRKSPYAGYYFHCLPGGSFAGGGLWMPEAATLKAVRQEIDYNFDEFAAIVNDKTFKKYFGDLHKGADISLSTVPKGYEKENPAISYLKLKCLIAETTITDEELLKPTLHRKVISVFRVLQPMLNFINRAID
jgi:uncharacterized protein (TIGR02453 family)